MTLFSRYQVCAFALVTAVAASAGWSVHAAAPNTLVAQQLTSASEGGPGMLLEALDQVLAADPSLVATPERAAALARLAATPVPDFVGANLPIYRDIQAKIVAAAPAAQRQAVQQAVGAELSRYVANDIRIMPPLQPRSVGTTIPAGPEIGALGYRVGSFTLYPSVQAGVFSDDNIYATRNDKVSDWIGTISPRIALQSNWKRHALYAEAGADLTGYWTHSRENTVDWHTLAEGRIDASKNTSILLGVIVLQEHEDRSSPDAVEGLVPTPYHELNGYAGVTHRFGDYTVRIGGAAERLTFGDVEGLHGLINNQDRDRNRYTFGVLVRDDGRPAFRPFVEALGDIRRYDQIPDDFGYVRNSDGYRMTIGAIFKVLPTLSGEAAIGVMGRSYTDPAFNTLTTPAADAVLRWQPGEGTAVVLFLDRSIEETTQPGSPAYIYTLVGGRVEQRLIADLTGIVRAAFAESSFVQDPRVDKEADISVGLRYRLTQNLVLGVDYRYTQRVSTESIYDFNRNQVFFEVSSAF